MEEFGVIIDLLKQLQGLVDSTGEQVGMPKGGAPTGVIPAKQGSTWDKKSIPSSLSSNEKSRVKQMAEIFKDVLFDKEARRVKSFRGSETVDNLKAGQRWMVGADEKEDKKGGGMLSGIMGMLGGTGGAAGMAASALPILAAFLGAGALAIAGGFAAKLVMEALKVAKAESRRHGESACCQGGISTINLGVFLIRSTQAPSICAEMFR